MPVPSRHVNIGRSQSWDAAGWYEGPWENAETLRHLGRRSSLTYGPGEGTWCEPQSHRAEDTVFLGATQPYLYHREAFCNSPDSRKGSVPDFTFYDSRRAVMSGRSTLLPQDYYGDPSRGTRVPKEPPYYRDPGVSRPSSSYGVLGSRVPWEQVQGQLPAPPDSNHLYRDAGGKMVPQGSRTQSRASSPGRYGRELPDSKFGAEAPTYTPTQVYSDVSERPGDSALARQVAPTCLVVDPGPASESSTGVASGTLNRGYGPSRESAPPKMAYENFEADLCTFQGPPAGKRNVLPEFLALLRTEGVAETTLAALLQQGFDSLAVLATLEDADIKSVAPNLGQARVLSRLASSCRTEMQLRRQDRTGPPPPPPRTRSSSFSQRSDLLPGDLGATALHPQPAGPLHKPSPHPGGLARRPSSAPSQHLLETAATYPAPGVGAQAHHVPSNSGHSSPTPCALTVRLGSSYPPQAGMALTNPGPRTAYSTSYTVPMELLKRERSAAASPLPSPHSSPQLLRKPGVPTEPSTLALASQSLHTPHSPYQKVARRTGAPILVSTMLTTEPSNMPWPGVKGTGEGAGI